VSALWALSTLFPRCKQQVVTALFSCMFFVAHLFKIEILETIKVHCRPPVPSRASPPLPEPSRVEALALGCPFPVYRTNIRKVPDSQSCCLISEPCRDDTSVPVDRLSRLCCGSTRMETAAQVSQALHTTTNSSSTTSSTSKSTSGNNSSSSNINSSSSRSSSNSNSMILLNKASSSRSNIIIAAIRPPVVINSKRVRIQIHPRRPLLTPTRRQRLAARALSRVMLLLVEEGLGIDRVNWMLCHSNLRAHRHPLPRRLVPLRETLTSRATQQTSTTAVVIVILQVLGHPHHPCNHLVAAVLLLDPHLQAARPEVIQASQSRTRVDPVWTRWFAGERFFSSHAK